MKTYGIEISDYRPRCERTIKLDGWKTAEEAAETAWQLLQTVAECDPALDYENQGDQFLAYYADGVTDDNGESIEGWGAVTFKVTNPDGSYYEDL